LKISGSPLGVSPSWHRAKYSTPESRCCSTHAPTITCWRSRAPGVLPATTLRP